MLGVLAHVALRAHRAPLERGQGRVPDTVQSRFEHHHEATHRAKNTIKTNPRRTHAAATPNAWSLTSYNQHNQESHGGLPHRQTPFVPHVVRYAPSKALEKPRNCVIKRNPKHRICGFPNLR